MVGLLSTHMPAQTRNFLRCPNCATYDHYGTDTPLHVVQGSPGASEHSGADGLRCSPGSSKPCCPASLPKTKRSPLGRWLMLPRKRAITSSDPMAGALRYFRPSIR